MLNKRVKNFLKYILYLLSGLLVGTALISVVFYSPIMFIGLFTVFWPIIIDNKSLYVTVNTHKLMKNIISKHDVLNNALIKLEERIIRIEDKNYISQPPKTF